MNLHGLKVALVAVGFFCCGAWCSPAAAQCDTCPTPVVAYQPVSVANNPGWIGGWYPGKLFDTWSANRAAYRTGYAPTVAAAPSVSYRPYYGSAVTSYYRSTYPTTAYRPVTVSYRAYSPIRLWRPLLPSVSTTVYQPVQSVVADSGCCGTVTSMTPACNDCCAVTSGTSGFEYGTQNVTPQPALDQNFEQRQRQPLDGQNGGEQGEKSAIDNNGDGGDNSEADNDEVNQNTGLQAPPLFPYGPNIENTSDTNGDRQARQLQREASIRQAVYRERVQPQFAVSKKAAKSHPSSLRKQRDAGWHSASD